LALFRRVTLFARLNPGNSSPSIHYVKFLTFTLPLSVSADDVAQKARVVKILRSGGSRVGFLGDGKHTSLVQLPSIKIIMNRFMMILVN
jgi:hypothetical protein